MTAHTVEMGVEADPKIHPWLAPISEEAPCGQNPRYSSSFEAIRAEIGKLEDPSAGQIQWALLVRMCDEALQKEAKDLSVASYLAMGWVYVDGFAGLERGAALLAALVDRYWATMYPEAARLRARVNAVTWYVDQLKHWLAHRGSGAAVSDENARLIESSLRAYQRFSEVARSRFADSAPALRGPEESLRRLLESARSAQSSPSSPPVGVESSAPDVGSHTPSAEHGDKLASPPHAAALPESSAPSIQLAQPAQPVQVESEGADAAPTVSAVPTVPSAAGVVSTNAVDQFLRQASRNLLVAVQSLRGQRENDPKVIRYWMSALYMSLHALPDSASVPAPPAALISQLQATLTAPSRAALGQAYWTLERHRFALDAHYVLNQLLTQLGPEWEAVRDAHRMELGGLLQRFSELAELRFADGSPVASDATQHWLAEQVCFPYAAPSVGTDPAPQGFVRAADASHSVQVDRGAAPRRPKDVGAATYVTGTTGAHVLSAQATEAMTSAAELAEQGKVDQALSVLQQACDLASDGAGRFELRLAAAELCARANLMQLAAPLFSELVGVIREHKIERWQKELASRTLFGFYQCLISLESSKDLSAATQGIVHAMSVDKHRLYVELCQLDPVRALQLAPRTRMGPRTAATS